jgi:hypothetical protein
MKVRGDEHPHLQADMAEAGGVMLYGPIGSAAFLRPNGSVWVHAAVDLINDPHTYEWYEANGNERWGALVPGARRMPKLQSLLPSRPPDAPNCSECRGSGFILGDLVCPDCGALGWVAPGAA